MSEVKLCSEMNCPAKSWKSDWLKKYLSGIKKSLCVKIFSQFSYSLLLIHIVFNIIYYFYVLFKAIILIKKTLYEKDFSRYYSLNTDGKLLNSDFV